ncbi:hypothetical protein H2201_007261 [Coniosporium apollinis]|uniref:SPX domain-containing protein n=1 Tax=Coniosporium apollinis TaxID=61459 RepID=A0ABQ9NJF6_9PEZI|nr:hypothetical protein H2201_007261 [Coniosporium apollinis]
MSTSPLSPKAPLGPRSPDVTAFNGSVDQHTERLRLSTRSLPKDPNVRVSNSPRNSPIVVQGHSPVKSIFIEMDGSIHNQPDGGMRTTDFFDDSSEDEVDEAPAAAAAVGQSPPYRSGAANGGSGPRDSVAVHKSRSNRKMKEESYLGSAPGRYVSQCGSSNDQPAPAVEEGGGDKDLHSSLLSATADFLRLTPGTPLRKLPHRRHVSDSPASSSSYPNSVDEIAATGSARHISMQAHGPGKIVHHSSPRVSAVFTDEERSSSPPVPLPLPLPSSLFPVPVPAETNDRHSRIKTQSIVISKADQILGAHEMTLQALLHDEGSPPPALTTTTRPISTAVGAFKHTRQRSASAPARKLSMAPPPIDTHHGHLPEDIVRTPYPFQFRKSFHKPSPLAMEQPPQPREFVLTVSLLRRRQGQGHTRGSSPRVGSIAIPADPDAAAKERAKSPKSKKKVQEQEFMALDFDDAHFFRELRRKYARLAGRWRGFGARTLKTIEVGQSSAGAGFGGPIGCGGEAASCYPRSPRFLARRGLTDTFSEEKLMQHFRCPKIGKARYAWVHWAQRIASSSRSLQPPTGLAAIAAAAGIGGTQWTFAPSETTRPSNPTPTTATGGKGTGTPKTTVDEKELLSPRSPQRRSVPAPESHSDGEALEVEVTAAPGLIFVEGWSVPRIVVALLIVFLLSIAAALLWIFLGVSAPGVGFRSAGQRVATGIVIGAFTLLLGWTAVLGWIAVSWLVS